jgi:hypothetical protein
MSSYEILTAIDPGIKSGTYIMPLIEEKIGGSFAGVYPDTYDARSVNVATVARNVHATAQRNRNVRNASL